MTEQRINKLKTSAGKFLAFSFVLVFLFAQSTSLLHSHAGDLKKHVDCELCLKATSDDDTLVVSYSTADKSITTTISVPVPILVASIETITAKSRSPPLYV